MTPNILTLCERCRMQYADAFRLKLISGNTATEKKKKCEGCGRSFGHSADLKQYLTYPKGGR